MNQIISRTFITLLVVSTSINLANSQDAEEIFQRGNSLSWDEKYEEALLYVDSSLNMDSSLYQRYAFRAELNAKLGRYEPAIEDFTKCIERCKCTTRKYHVSSYYLERAQLQLRNKNTEAAISDATKSILSNPNKWESYNFRSNLLVQSGKLNEGLNDLSKSISINDNQAETFIARGKLSIQMDDIEGACNDLSKVASWGFDEFEHWIQENCK